MQFPLPMPSMSMPGAMNGSIFPSPANQPMFNQSSSGWGTSAPSFASYAPLAGTTNWGPSGGSSFPTINPVRRYSMPANIQQFCNIPPSRIFYVGVPCGDCQPPCPPPPPPPPQPCMECLPCYPVAPPPTPPPPAPAAATVVHFEQREDCCPKLRAMEREARRLEALLSAAKDTEGQLRMELAEMTGRAQRADQLAARLQQMESEMALMRSSINERKEVHSRTDVRETYKVKTFEMAAKLAEMDGTDDGLYNGLPIEVDGQGLYRDLVASGRRPRQNVSLSGRPLSIPTVTQTYKVHTMEMADRMARADGTHSGTYNGIPIEVVGEGLYQDLTTRGRRYTPGSASGHAAAPRSTTPSITASRSALQTYKVPTLEMAARVSRMGTDDGTYKGLPIEVEGVGLYRDIRQKR
jgi:hypothetical protein